MTNQPALDPKQGANRRSFVLIFSTVSAWLLQHSICCADDLLAIRRGRRRVQPLCSVPPADYQHTARTPSVVARSLPALPRYARENVNSLLTIVDAYNKDAVALENATLTYGTLGEIVGRNNLALEKRLQAQAAGNQLNRPISKLMQIANGQLTIGHCSFSDVCLLIDPAGYWHVSLRGSQNFLRRDDARERNLDLQIKRNAFQVKVRLLRSVRTGGENLTPSVGGEPEFYQASKPAVAAIDVPEFWVQREAPRSITQTGFHPAIAAHYDDIDQAEFEFFVKLDTLTGNGHGVIQPWQK